MIPKEIEYFLTIAEVGSLSKAAEKVYVSQPALSKYLAKLEDTYGTLLFERMNNSLVLTEAGKIYYESALQIAEICNSTDKRIEDIRDDGKRTFSIGVTGESSQNLLGHVFPLLYEKYPNLHIHVIERPAQELAELLKKGEIDLALYAIYNADDKALTYIDLANSELVLAIPAQHRLAQYGKPDILDDLNRIDLSELKDEKFVLLNDNTAMRQIVDRYFKENSFTPHIAIETKGRYSTMTFVDSGVAIGFCPTSYRRHFPNIRYIALTKPLYSHSGLFYKRGAYLTAPMRDLILFFKNHYLTMMNNQSLFI